MLPYLEEYLLSRRLMKVVMLNVQMVGVMDVGGNNIY